MPLLSARNISHFYGSRRIFSGLSLDLHRNSVLLLAGENGAGKSTLLKILAGLIRPATGEVTAHEDDAGREPRIGYLGHQTFLYPELSALENLHFWASWQGLRLGEADFEDMLARVELSSFAEEKAGGFSRGMAQRLNLARVFLLDPEILLLDEPGTGLDTRSTAVLQREIASARDKGAGVVWITHHLAEDCKRADMVALLAEKSLRFYGPIREFIRSGLSGAPDLPSPPDLSGSASGISPLSDPDEMRQAHRGEPC